MISTMSVYDTLMQKIKNGETSLTPEEREKAEELLRDDFENTELRYSDENLMQLMDDRELVI